MKNILTNEITEDFNFRCLVNKKVVDVHNCLDLIIINFGTDDKVIEYSLHSTSFTRFIKNEKLLLTSTDVFFDELGNDIENDDKTETLMKKHISEVNKALKGQTVKSVSKNKIGDLTVEFENGIVMQTIIDFIAKEQECYRFIEFVPGEEERGILKSKRHLVFYATLDGITNREE